MSKNYFKIAGQFVKDSVREAKKVTWPTREQLTHDAVVVLGAIFVSLVVIAAIDYGLSLAVKKLFLGV